MKKNFGIRIKAVKFSAKNSLIEKTGSPCVHAQAGHVTFSRLTTLITLFSATLTRGVLSYVSLSSTDTMSLKTFLNRVAFQCFSNGGC